MEEFTEREMITQIMKSMGIDPEMCEPNVAVAFEAYARRFAGELLRDAMDYANHANRTDIDIEDIRLAIRMSDSYVTGIDPRLQIINKVADSINQKSLESMLPKENVFIRYPPDLQDSLLQRTFTCVPGTQAYPTNDAPKQLQGDRAGIETTSHTTGGIPGKFQSMDISRKGTQRKPLSTSDAE